MVKADDESKTMETRLDFDKGVFDCIELLLRFFAGVRGKENPNELKSALIRGKKVTSQLSERLRALIKESRPSARR